MEDIIVNEPAPISVKSSKKKKFRRVGPKRDFSVYLFDWLVKGLIIALLISIDFLVFSSAGNFSIFSSGFTVAPEVFFIIGGIFAVALCLMFLISFSSFLQNVVAAGTVGFFVYLMLNQFALFDKASFLSYLLSPYLGNDVALHFIGNSDIVAAGAASVVAFVFFAMAEKKNIAYFMGILFVVFLGISADEYFNRYNHDEYKTVYDNSFSKSEKGKKFIYIMLPNATSLSYLEDMKDANADVQKVEKLQNIILGFLTKNGFMLYPNAFVGNDDAFMNAVRNLNNLSAENEDSFVASSVMLDGYWSFKNLNDEYVYLNDNQLYGVFRRAKYKISAYKTRGIDLCNKNGVRNSDRCVEKINTPVSFDNMELSVLERTKMLFVQWLDSMKIFNNMSPLYKMLKAFTRPDNMPMIGVKSDNLYVVNAPQILEKLGEDIVKDKGNQAYFVLLDLPSNMFIYDEYCKVKPTSQWLHMESLPWIINKNLFNKRTAYLEQSACLYGKLEQFVEYLKKSGVLDNSVIVIQGLSGADDLQNVKERQFVLDFKNKKLVMMAIRDPLKKKFVVSEEICKAPDILNQYLFRKGKCVELKDLNIHSGAKKELKGMLARYVIDNEMSDNALKAFDDWYKIWEKYNKPEEKFEKLEKVEVEPIKKDMEKKKEEKSSEQPSDEEVAELIKEGQPDELLPLKESVEKQAEKFEEEVAAEGEKKAEVPDKAGVDENLNSSVNKEEHAEDDLANTEMKDERVIEKAPIMTSEVAEQIEQKVESLKKKMKEESAAAKANENKE